MNAGLWWLARRLWWGKLRFLARRARTPKGAAALALGSLLVLAVAATQLWALWMMRDAGLGAPPPDAVRRWAPPALLGMTVLALLSSRALYFTRPEVDFLFPAPVSRRERLVYALVARLDVQVFSALWMALFTVRLAPSPWSALAGTLAAFVFLYTASQALGVAAAALEPWLPPAVRRLGLAALAAGAVAVVWTAASSVAPGAPLPVRAAAVAEHPVVRALSVPARPFVELFLAGDPLAALLWLAASAAVIGALVGLTLGFDVAYEERSLAVSARLHARLARMRAGGGVVESDAPSLRRLRIPPMPFLGAAEPFARRQLLELARNPRALVAPAAMGALWLAAVAAQPATGSGAEGTTALLVMGVLFPVLFTAHLGYDFRRDLDRMPLLKSLPVRPMAVAAGQVFPVALVFTLLQYALVAAIVAVARGGVRTAWLPALALAIPPLTWAALSLDNLLFLLMPYRVSAAGEPNAQFVGKTMLSMLAKLVLLGVCALVAGAAAWGAGALGGGGWTLAAAAVGALVLCCLPLTWAVAAAFAAFDPAHDVPAET